MDFLSEGTYTNLNGAPLHACLFRATSTRLPVLYILVSVPPVAVLRTYEYNRPAKSSGSATTTDDDDPVDSYCSYGIEFVIKKSVWIFFK